MSINQVIVSGNVVRDCSLRGQVASFTVAVNTRKKSIEGNWEDKPNFIDCKLFGSRAEALYPFIKKGVKVAVSGRLDQYSWTDKDTGSKRSKVEVICNEIELFSSENRSKKSQKSSDNFSEKFQKVSENGTENGTENDPYFSDVDLPF